MTQEFPLAIIFVLGSSEKSGAVLFKWTETG
jgi:hypothetical protein